MAEPLYNQTTLFQTVSLLLFCVKGASEHDVIPATERGNNLQLSYRNSMAHSLRSKSTRYYPSRVIFEK